MIIHGEMLLVMIVMIGRAGVCDNDNGAGCGAGLGWAGLAGCCTLLPDVSLRWWLLVAEIGVKTVANHQQEMLAAMGRDPGLEHLKMST